MGPIPFLSKSRGFKNLISRIRSVLTRFGFTAKKYKRLLYRYVEVTHRLGCIPTFPITAVTLRRHPKLIRELSRQGIEFTVHGYLHTDYGVLSLEEQMEQFKKATDTFHKSQVPFSGFRAPFLRTNSVTIRALSESKFDYDSSQAVHWGVIDEAKYTGPGWREYQRLLDFYKSRNTGDYLALPRSIDGLVEIPVSIPDDEAMVDRLGILQGEKISEIWGSILKTTHQNGELFTLQLHPERILLCESALAGIIQQARQLEPAVWVATLREIAEWWKEKGKFVFEVSNRGVGKYGVKAICSDRATVLLKNVKTDTSIDKWFDSYQSITAREFVLESPKRPVIGMSRDSSAAAINYLKSEGYIVEFDTKPEDCGIFLENLKQFSDADEKELSHRIEQSNASLIRYWRWPDRARSAMSITGDIDSITLIDFMLRILENSFEKWRQRRLKAS